MAKYNSVTDNEIEQAKKYKDALDELQKSVVGLNSKLPSFADGLKAGLQGIGEKLPGLVQSMVDLNKQNKALAETGGKPVGVLAQLASSMLSWNSLISVGITLLASFGGAIINWISDLAKGETRLTRFGQAMQECVILNNAITQARSKGAQSAQGEITLLDTLYRATQNAKLGKEGQAKAMQALRDQWPATFKGLKDDAFNTDVAAKAYKNLKEQILDAAYAEAYKNKITANATRDIDDDLKIARERENNIKLLAKVKQAKIDLADYNEKTRGNFSSSGGITLYDNIEIAKEEVAKSDKAIIDMFTDKNRIKIINKKLASEIDKLTEKEGNGVDILTGGKKDEPVIPKKNGKGNGKGKSNNTNSQIVNVADESVNILNNYNKQIEITNKYYNTLKTQKNISKTELEQIEKDRNTTLNYISNKFRTEDVQKLEQYQHELNQIAIDNTTVAKEKAIMQLQEDERQKLQTLDNEHNDIQSKIILQQNQLIELKKKGSATEINALTSAIASQQILLNKAGEVRIAYEKQIQAKIEAIQAGKDPEAQNAPAENKPEDTATDKAGKAKNPIQEQIDNWQTEKTVAIKIAKEKGQSVFDVEAFFAVKKINLEAQLISSKMHIADGFINFALNNTKKESAIYKAAFIAKKAVSISDVMITTTQAVMKSFGAYSYIPFIGQALGIAQAAFMAAQGAASIATIVKQKPGFAAGGQYISDGRGALLTGYSPTDNTNAYLRSGEAVVVSEAMRNPWARNLVSAINVAHGGRDFSMPNTGRGYAIGGIFTDGGNANRYYTQPVNDIKDMANTLAYQMINNFPPIYVDVKDVNNQQNILAQTVNRVNL